MCGRLASFCPWFLNKKKQIIELCTCVCDNDIFLRVAADRNTVFIGVQPSSNVITSNKLVHLITDATSCVCSKFIREAL